MLKNASRRKGKGQAGKARARALHVLVVENHFDTRQGITAFLKVLGHRASFAEDVAGALALAGQETFDLLLSDISLPDGTGWELLHALNANGRRPSHAIAMSGLGDPADFTRSREAGFETHLVKPFRPEELEQALRRAADSPPRPDGPAPAPAPRVPAVSMLRTRLHDGLCQHLAAAALLQGALTNRLEAMVEAGGAKGSSARLQEAATESRQISRLIDEALEETLSVMRSA